MIIKRAPFWNSKRPKPNVFVQYFQAYIYLICTHVHTKENSQGYYVEGKNLSWWCPSIPLSLHPFIPLSLPPPQTLMINQKKEGKKEEEKKRDEKERGKKAGKKRKEKDWGSKKLTLSTYVECKYVL